MTSNDVLNSPTAALVDAANAFHQAADRPGSHVGAPESLDAVQTALRLISAAWYRVAADAVPSVHERDPDSPVGGQAPTRTSGRSREQDVVLVGALHDAAAAFAKCARACRESEVKVASVIDRTPDPSSARLQPPAAGAATDANAQLSREQAA
jgi:hypothetical protein